MSTWIRAGIGFIFCMNEWNKKTTKPCRMVAEKGWFLSTRKPCTLVARNESTQIQTSTFILNFWSIKRNMIYQKCSDYNSLV